MFHPTYNTLYKRKGFLKSFCIRVSKKNPNQTFSYKYKYAVNSDPMGFSTLKETYQ